MAEPVITDVFKFVAVRPPQLVTDQETERTVIRDTRAADADGKSKLAALARSVTPPAAALARWKELDLASLTLLADAYRGIVRRYESLGQAASPLDAAQVIKDAGVSKSLTDAQAHLAWDAIYIADSTGFDAGPKLEKPMAALRLFHFAELLSRDKRPARAAALEALLATPAIPRAFYEARIASAPSAPADDIARPISATDQENSTRSQELRSLAQDLVASERLLTLLTDAAPSSTAVMQAGPVAQQGSWQRSEFYLQGAPTLRTALTGQLSRDEAALLDRVRIDQAAPVHVAAQALQGHLTKLSKQAFALGGNSEFEGYLRDLTS